MKYFLLFISASISILTGCNNGSSSAKADQPADVAAKAKQIFMVSCSQCHKPDEDMIGPALKGAKERWKDKDLLYAYVRNPQEVISRDAYAKALFEKWKFYPMQPFPNLSNEEIDAILAYCNGESK